MKNTNLSSNINPFELGTNEYNQKTANNSTFGNFLGGLMPNYATDSRLSEVRPQTTLKSFHDAAQNKEQQNSLAFGSKGDTYLKFDRPPDEFARKFSLEALEQAKVSETEEQSGSGTDILEPFIPMDFKFKEKSEVIEINQPQEEIEEDKGFLGGFFDSFFGVFKKTLSFLFKVMPNLGSPTKEMTTGFASIFTEGFMAKPDRQKTKEELEAEKKEAEKGKNKKIFFEKLVELTRVMPISDGLRAEMIATNQANLFTEEYVGVVERNSGITTYHSTNRRKKEAEIKAANIAKERASKIQSASKKTQGFGQREGELLMGAENPSHFTKALG